jgi:altronate hydrolase
MNTLFIRLHPADDVVIARSQIISGANIEGHTSRGLIPAGHKIATRDLAIGDPVRRYNQIIGFASKAISAGEHVHTQNLNMGENKGDFTRDYAIGSEAKPALALSDSKKATFMGIKRSDGRVATRNYIGILFGHSSAGDCGSFFTPLQSCGFGKLPHGGRRDRAHARHRLRYG